MSRGHVYFVSPWRRTVLWYTLGPVVLFLLLGAIFSRESAEPLLVCVALMVLIAAPFEWIIRRTRLVLSEKGIQLLQTGYRLEAPWADVERLRLDRGREGFVLSRPMASKGATRLAGFRGTNLDGMSLYDAEQQALLAEQRFIPFDAFAWHLRHGRLRADLEELAPHLSASLIASLDSPPPRPAPRTMKDQMKGQLVVALIVFALALGVVLILAPPSWSNWFFGSADAILAPLFTLSTGYSAWCCFRQRSWILGTLMLAMTLLCATWTISTWERIGQLAR